MFIKIPMFILILQILLIQHNVNFAEKYNAVIIVIIDNKIHGLLRGTDYSACSLVTFLRLKAEQNLMQ